MQSVAVLVNVCNAVCFTAVGCPTHCKVCTADNNCNDCEDGYITNSDNTGCVGKCPVLLATNAAVSALLIFYASVVLVGQVHIFMDSDSVSDSDAKGSDSDSNPEDSDSDSSPHDSNSAHYRPMVSHITSCIETVCLIKFSGRLV